MSVFMNWRVRCGLLLLVVLAGLTGCNKGSSLDGETTEPPPPSENTGDGIATRTIDATGTGEWVYFNLAANAVVYPAQPENSRDWDIAFQRFKIKVNSGVSGNGGARVGVARNTAFDAVTAVPPQTEYFSDRVLNDLTDAELIALDAGQFFAVCSVGPASCIDTQNQTVDRTRLNPDIAAYAMLTIGSGIMYQGGTQKPILGWYNYYFDENHVLRPTGDTWLIKTVDGYDIKLQMLGYYGQNNSSESGNVAFRYRSLTPGFTVPPPGAAQFKVALSASTIAGTAPLAVDFTAATSGGTPAQWQWDFGDGTTSTEMTSAHHVYQGAGTYVARLTVTDQRGAVATQAVTITVYALGQQPVFANAGPDQLIALTGGATQTQVTLDAAASYVPDGAIAGYAWIGSPKPNDQRAPQLTLGIGRYEFIVVVTDDRGRSAEDALEVVVGSPTNAPPFARIAATPETGAAPLTVQFDASASSDADGTIVSYLWDFGDGASASTVAPTHDYTQPGRYRARLTVTDDGGAVATITRIVDVALVVAPSADTYVYEFLGNQTPSESLLVWNHESNHGARIVMDFDALDARLAALPAGRFTATLKMYAICDLAAGIGLVQACPGYADAGGKATVTTDVFAQGLAWAENGALPWSGVQEQGRHGKPYATFVTDSTDTWIEIDVTGLVEAWRVAGSTGNGIVLSQEAYPVVRADNLSIAVLGFYSRESAQTDKRPYLEIHLKP